MPRHNSPDQGRSLGVHDPQLLNQVTLLRFGIFMTHQIESLGLADLAALWDEAVEVAEVGRQAVRSEGC